MRIKASVQSYKLEVLNNEGIAMLSASAENVEFDADVVSLVQELSRMNTEMMDSITKAAETGCAHTH